MDEPRLRSKLLVQAGVRLCSERGVAATVARRGDPDAGAVYVKLNLFERGCAVLNRARTGEGRMAWLRATGDAPVAEAEADAWLEREAGRDPDIWVLEVEDRAGRNPFEEAPA